MFLAKHIIASGGVEATHLVPGAEASHPHYYAYQVEEHVHFCQPAG